MKSKINLLFSLLYFFSIFLGYISILFRPLFDNIYYEHITDILCNILRTVIYLILAISLNHAYKKIVKPIKKQKTELSLKRVTVLYLITIGLITIISIMSGWQLKPFSELGERYNALTIYTKLSELSCLVIEVYFMMCMFACFEKFCNDNNYKNYEYFCPSIFFVLLTFGIYQLIVYFNIYQLVFIPFIILLGFIYPYTNKSFWKTYAIAVIVFLI